MCLSDFLLLVIFQMLSDHFNRLIADVMLNTAGILSRDLLADSQQNQRTGQNTVALKDLLRNLAAAFGQGQDAVRIHVQIPAAAQNADCTADARLGIAQMLTDIDGTHPSLLCAQNQNGLQIHLARFQQLHGNQLLSQIVF